MDQHTDASGEDVLWSGTISQWHYAGRWIFVGLLIAALSATFFMPLPDQVPGWIARAVLAALALIIVAWIKIDRSRRKYRVSNKRVSVEFGIISKTSNEMRVQDIRSINLTTKGLPGIFGIGRIEFSSAATDDADVIFWNVPDAARIRDMIRSLQAHN